MKSHTSLTHECRLQVETLTQQLQNEVRELTERLQSESKRRTLAEEQNKQLHESLRLGSQRLASYQTLETQLETLRAKYVTIGSEVGVGVL